MNELKKYWVLLAGAGAAYAVYRYIAGAGEELIKSLDSFRIANMPNCEPVRPYITSVAEAEDFLQEWGLQVTAEYSSNLCNYKGAFYQSYIYGIIQDIELANDELPEPEYAMPFAELGAVFVRSHGIENPFACTGEVKYPFSSVSNLQQSNCIPCDGYDEINAFTGDPVCNEDPFGSYEELCSAFPNLSEADNQFCSENGFVTFTDEQIALCDVFFDYAPNTYCGQGGSQMQADFTTCLNNGYLYGYHDATETFEYCQANAV